MTDTIPALDQLSRAELVQLLALTEPTPRQVAMARWLAAEALWRELKDQADLLRNAHTRAFIEQLQAPRGREAADMVAEAAATLRRVELDASRAWSRCRERYSEYEAAAREKAA